MTSPCGPPQQPRPVDSGDNCARKAAPERQAEPGLAEKKRRVRELLIAPLDEIGLTRKRGVTVEAHAQQLDTLAKRLAYMSPVGLELLREQIETAAVASGKDVWPSVVAILGIAKRIEEPPVEEMRLVPTWMASREGRETWARDPVEAAELLRWLRAKRRPPLYAMDKRQIAERAAERRISLDGAARRRDEGRASDADMAMLAAWASEREEVRQMVFAGGERA